MPKGSHIFKARDGFSESAANFALRAADFEIERIRIPDKSSQTSGIFVLPVDSQTAYGTDGKILATFILYSAVGANEASTEKLERTGWRKFNTVNEATNVAKIHNNDEYTRARKLSGIATMQREEIDLSSLLILPAAKAAPALAH